MSEPINIPGYRIERKLGQGGMAAVYLAIQQSFEREVALKIMSPLLNSDPSFTTRFIREARIVAHIHHASIVPVFDVGEHQPYHYLSMEYLPGGDLKQRILRGECTAELLLEVCGALCAALDVAHRKGYVHRDIKPENILFREDGTPVLTDFGIARAVDSGTSLTVAGMLVGTPSYMSPEQVKGQELDGRSDLYSLGIVCYEMLTGTVPFRADSTMSVAIKHLVEALPPLPRELSAYQSFMDRLTAKERTERFASGSEVMQALRAVRLHAPHADMTLLRAAPDLSRLPTTRTTAPRYRAAMLMASAASAARAIAATTASVASTTAETARKLASRTAEHGAQLREFWERRPRPLLPGFAATIDFNARTAMWAAAGVAGVLLVAVLLTLGGQSDRQHASLASVPESSAPAAAGTMPATEPVMHGSTTATEPPAEDIRESPAEEPAVEAERLQQQAQDRARRSAERQRLAEEQRQRDQEAQALAQRDREQRVKQLLADAKNQYAQGHLATPSGASAADRFREVLQLEPAQPDALAGLQRIANVLVEEATHAQSVGNADSLRSLIAQIAWVQPGHQKLVELQTGLLALVANPEEPTTRESANLERASRHVAKAYEYLDRKPFDMRAADTATEHYDRAVDLMPTAPGLPSLRERLIAAYPEAVRTELRDRDPKRAMRMINYARKRSWMSPDLESLEASIRSGIPAPAMAAE